MNEESRFRAVKHFENLELEDGQEQCKRGHLQENQFFVNRLFKQLNNGTAYYLLAEAAVCSRIFYTKPCYLHATK